MTELVRQNQILTTQVEVLQSALHPFASLSTIGMPDAFSDKATLGWLLRPSEIRRAREAMQFDAADALAALEGGTP